MRRPSAVEVHLASILLAAVVICAAASGSAQAERIYGHVYNNGLGYWSYDGTRICDDLREMDTLGPGFEIEPATPGYRSLFVSTIGAPQLYVPEVYVPVGGEAEVELDTGPAYYVTDKVRGREGSISQGFVADDGNHIMGFHWPAIDRWNTEDDVWFALGSPHGPQVGPACNVHMTYYDIHHDTATWSAGEIPLLPGEKYFVRIGWFGGSRTGGYVSGSDVYPGGEFWKDGDTPIYTEDMTGMVADEVEGVLTVFHNKVTGSVWEPLGEAWAQTFVAYGDYVVAADCVPGVGDLNPDYIVTIREGGPDGPQVGPAKQLYNAGGNFKYHPVVWRPGEVPVVPGQTYALQVQHIYGYRILLWHSPLGDDHYPHGTAYRKNSGVWTDAGWDIKGCVVTSGSLPSIGVSGVQAAVCDTSAEVTFDTDTPSMCRVVFGPTEDYGNKAGPELDFTADHTLYLHGLLPDTDYTYRADACAHFRDYTQSGPHTFHTAPMRTEMLNAGLELGDLSRWSRWVGPDPENAGFEDGYSPCWREAGKGIEVEDWPGTWDIQPRTGNYMAWHFGESENAVGYVGQQVRALPGHNYRGSCWSCLYQVCSEGSAENCRSRIGIDPLGGTDPASGSVVWGVWHERPPLTVPEWIEIECVAAAQSETITVWMQYQETFTDTGYQGFVNAFDDLNVGILPGGSGPGVDWEEGPLKVDGWYGVSGLDPRSGSYHAWQYQGSADKSGGLYQRVAAVPGVTYQASVWSNLHLYSGPEVPVETCRSRLGIDPAGGRDPYNPSVVWCDWDVRPFAEAPYWKELTVQAECESDAVTVFIEYKEDYLGGYQYMANCFDDASLTALTVVGDVDEIKELPDGAGVQVGDKVVTATAAQIGAYYVQEPGRYSGIRVEASSGSAEVGDTVTVTGTLGTIDGERVMLDAQIIVTSGE